MPIAKPWLKYYGNVPHTIAYPQVTMYEALMHTVERCPDAIAYDFFGTTATYRQFAEEIGRCADALAALGMKPGDRMTISMPTCPQAVVCFYAVNKLGGVASMIHPLSTSTEIAFYLNLSQSRFALTLDAFYGKFADHRARDGAGKTDPGPDSRLPGMDQATGIQPHQGQEDTGSADRSHGGLVENLDGRTEPKNRKKCCRLR
jgi:acyl-CoA synthetase (AMP-forming)/AMP-acid ligase II